MFTVTFARHGESKMNVAYIVQSRTPGELTERGVKMAECLGKSLSAEKFTRIYSSDLKRAHDTTLNILKQSSNQQPEVVLDETLRERDYGDLEGQSIELCEKIQQECGLPNHTIPLPGGESYEATKERIGKFFNGLCKLADATNIPENVLVVTHGGLLMCLLDYLADTKDLFELVNCDEKRRTMRPDNTAVTKLIIHKKGGEKNEGEKRKLEFYKIFDTSHLTPDLL